MSDSLLKYLKLLVEEIRYQNRQLIMKGSYAAVARVAGEGKLGTLQGTVPTFDLDWLTTLDKRQNFQNDFHPFLTSWSFYAPCSKTSLMVETREVDFSRALTYPSA